MTAALGFAPEGVRRPCNRDRVVRTAMLLATREAMYGSKASQSSRSRQENFMKSLSVTKDGSSSGTSVPSEVDRSKIEGVLQTYETALNASDTDAVMTVFTSDGVFMAPNSPSAVGADAVLAAYSGIFQAIAFDTELQVDEIVQVAPNWAFVRTRSNGFVTVNATKARVPDANHELFVFQKDGGDAWKIARYSFSSINPPPR